MTIRVKPFCSTWKGFFFNYVFALFRLITQYDISQATFIHAKTIHSHFNSERIMEFDG